MAQANESAASVSAGSRHVTRRGPNAHDAAVQEAKRLEKMQSHSSSHRAGGAGPRPDTSGTAAAEAR